MNKKARWSEWTVARALAGACLCLLAGTLSAQTYPSKPIRIIVASGAGGGTDHTGRLVARAMSDALKLNVFVENRPGAGSTTGTEYAARAAPDGYTLLVSSGSSIVMNPIIYRNLPYDPQRDFVPVGLIAAYPFMLVVRPDMPATTLADFVKFAKERPGKLTYGSAGVGSVQHVWGTILFKSLGLDLVHVPYKGAAAGHQDIIAGRVDAMFDNLSASKKFADSGRLKGIAVSAPARSPQMPQVPTINETGLTRFDAESWMGMFAPAATPGPIVDSLRSVLAGVARDPEFIARVEAAGGRVMNVPPREQQAFVKEEIERWTRLVATYEVKAE